MRDQRPTFNEVASKVLAERSRLKKQRGKPPVKAWEYPVPKIPVPVPAADGTAG